MYVQFTSCVYWERYHSGSFSGAQPDSFLVLLVIFLHSFFSVFVWFRSFAKDVSNIKQAFYVTENFIVWETPQGEFINNKQNYCSCLLRFLQKVPSLYLPISCSFLPGLLSFYPFFWYLAMTSETNRKSSYISSNYWTCIQSSFNKGCILFAGFSFTRPFQTLGTA